MLRNVLRRPAAVLALLAACAGLAWGALLAVHPDGLESRVFFERGKMLFGDFTTTRICAEYGYATDRIPAYDACYPALGPTLVRPFPLTSTGGAWYTGLGILVFLTAFAELLRTRGRSAGEIVVWTVAVGFSQIMLHAFEWGNQILTAAAAVTLFLAWFESASAVKRRLAAVALAVACVLKITPAALAVLYLVRLKPGDAVARRRALGDFAWFVGAGLVLFVVPFTWYGGWTGFTHWLQNALVNGKAYAHRGAWGAVPIVRTFHVLRHLDVSQPWDGLWMPRACSALAGLVCLATGTVRLWRSRLCTADSLLLVVAGMLLVPANMHVYTGLYLLPVLAWRAAEGMGWFEAACWFVFLSPLQIPLGAGCLNHPLANLAFLALVARTLWPRRRSKNELRKAMRARRKALAPETKARASELLCDKALRQEALNAALTLRDGKSVVCAVYLASPDELDLSAAIRAYLARGVTVVAPRWNGATYELAKLASLQQADLHCGPMGIWEPQAEAERVAPQDVAVWFVPGLAFTAKGGRLGYGGGWYDRLMAQADPHALKVGVAHDFQMVGRLPREPHDIVLDTVLVAGL